LLALSLFFKIRGSVSQQEVAASDTAGRIAAFLKRNGFETDEGASDEDMFLVSATAGECSLLVAVLSPEGWHRHVLRKLTPAGSQLIFLFNGITYEDQPVMLTRFYYYWSRLLRLAGGDPPLRPVFGIVGSPECGLDDIRWSELASFRSNESVHTNL